MTTHPASPKIAPRNEVGIGLALSMVFDPKASETTELIDRKADERHDEESGAGRGG